MGVKPSSRLMHKLAKDRLALSKLAMMLQEHDKVQGPYKLDEDQ